MTRIEPSPIASRPRVRLVMVTHYFPAHRGGVEVVAGEIARRLADEGIADVEWYATATHAPPASRPHLRCIGVPGCNLAERRLGFPFPLWGAAGTWKMMRAVRNADAVLIHDCLYLPNVVAWAVAKLYARPIVVTQHVGMVPYRSRLLRALVSLANRVLGSLVLGSATRTVFVSDAVLQYFAAFVRFRTAPLRIANGVDTVLFQPASAEARDALRTRLDLPRNRPVLLFAGRFVEKKGLALLHRLAQRMPRAYWIFAGWGPLDPAAWRLPNVRVERDLEHAALVLRYQAADLLVLPSVGEGFPLVVQEAMACGTPALVSTDTAAGCPEAAEVLAAEALGARAEERWQARLEALLASADHLARLRLRVTQFATSRWSWEQCARRYGELLHACLA